MCERDAQRRSPDHGYRRGLVHGMLLDRNELRRQDDAHVQGHRDGLADGLAGGRSAQCRDHGLASLHLALLRA